MAGIVSNGIAIDYPDGEGSCKIGARVYRWEFMEWGGPLFLRKDGDPLKIQPRENHSVWKHFEKWHRRYRKLRAKAKSWETVAC